MAHCSHEVSATATSSAGGGNVRAGHLIPSGATEGTQDDLSSSDAPPPSRFEDTALPIPPDDAETISQAQRMALLKSEGRVALARAEAAKLQAKSPALQQLFDEDQEDSPAFVGGRALLHKHLPDHVLQKHPELASPQHPHNLYLKSILKKSHRRKPPPDATVNWEAVLWEDGNVVFTNVNNGKTTEELPDEGWIRVLTRRLNPMDGRYVWEDHYWYVDPHPVKKRVSQAGGPLRLSTNVDEKVRMLVKHRERQKMVDTLALQISGLHDYRTFDESLKRPLKGKRAESFGGSEFGTGFPVGTGAVVGGSSSMGAVGAWSMGSPVGAGGVEEDGRSKVGLSPAFAEGMIVPKDTEQKPHYPPAPMMNALDPAASIFAAKTLDTANVAAEQTRSLTDMLMTMATLTTMNTTLSTINTIESEKSRRYDYRRRRGGSSSVASSASDHVRPRTKPKRDATDEAVSKFFQEADDDDKRRQQLYRFEESLQASPNGGRSEATRNNMKSVDQRAQITAHPAPREGQYDQFVRPSEDYRMRPWDDPELHTQKPHPETSELLGRVAGLNSRFDQLESHLKGMIANAQTTEMKQSLGGKGPNDLAAQRSEIANMEWSVRDLQLRLEHNLAENRMNFQRMMYEMQHGPSAGHLAPEQLEAMRGSMTREMQEMKGAIMTGLETTTRKGLAGGESGQKSEFGGKIGGVERGAPIPAPAGPKAGKQAAGPKAAAARPKAPSLHSSDEFTPTPRSASGRAHTGFTPGGSVAASSVLTPSKGGSVKGGSVRSRSRSASRSGSRRGSSRSSRRSSRSRSRRSSRSGSARRSRSRSVSRSGSRSRSRSRSASGSARSASRSGSEERSRPVSKKSTTTSKEQPVSAKDAFKQAKLNEAARAVSKKSEQARQRELERGAMLGALDVGVSHEPLRGEYLEQGVQRLDGVDLLVHQPTVLQRCVEVEIEHGAYLLVFPHFLDMLFWEGGPRGSTQHEDVDTKQIARPRTRNCSDDGTSTSSGIMLRKT